MSTQVAVLGRGRAWDQEVAFGRHLLHHPVDDEGGLVTRLTPGAHTLVLAEQRDALVLRRICAGVAVSGDAPPVAGLALPHGPLALTVLGALATASPASPACLLTWLDGVARSVWSAAWLQTVSGVEDPSPSLGQHVRSWLPGGKGFLLEHAPVSRVTRVRDGRSAAPSGPVPEGAETLPMAALSIARQRSAGQHLLAEASAAHPRYGTSVVELATQPDPLPPRPQEAGLPSCPVCGIPLPREVCPYCRARVAPAAQEVP